MTRETPSIDSRSAEIIFSQLKQRTGLCAGAADPLGEALLRIFARYCELIIQRLNRVPEKNYLTFLNYLGVSRIPPVAAQVPLTFFPVKNVSPINTSITVPHYTQVAAPPGPGEGEPVVFETARSLELTIAELHRIVSWDPYEDLYTEINASLSPEEGGWGIALFKGKIAIEHTFYIGHSGIFGSKNVSRLHLHFTLDKEPLPQPRGSIIEWFIPGAEDDLSLMPVKDTTAQLTRSGELVFENPPKWEAREIYRKGNCWLGCRLLIRLTSGSDESRRKLLRQLPSISGVEITAESEAEYTGIGTAFFNNLSLDLSKDFFPFGERPRFGDVFYLSSDAFSQHRADISVKITLTNPASSGESSPIPSANRKGQPVIQWEYWNGVQWVALDCHDETRALTETGTVSFAMPHSTGQTLVQGVESEWIRARLVSGCYGVEERFVFSGHEQAGQGFRHVASTLAPPSIQSIAVRASMKMGPERPEDIVTHNNFLFEDVDFSKTAAFLPFRPAEIFSCVLYLGFKAPAPQVLAGRVIELYFRVSQAGGRIFYGGETLHPSPSLIWQCWNGDVWKTCTVSDGTASLTATGNVRIGIDENISAWRGTSLDAGAQLYWLRVIWAGGEYQCQPVLERVLLNTTMATQTMTLENELLGSSNGTSNQVFYSGRVPIIEDLFLDVREPHMPVDEKGKNAVSIVRNAKGQVEEIWVRWHNVDDFLHSNELDRHFVVDRLSGGIWFGDGTRGLVPPSGANNIRLRNYKTGGGVSGNKPAHSVVQLRASLPLVDSVVNAEAAFGGQDVEDWDSVSIRGSRWLRHRGRAVTAEDYEDLARLSSPQVARAQCYPLRDLSTGSLEKTDQPGVVSLVIVPWSTEPEPKPDPELLRRVWQYLGRRRDPGAELVLVSPEYVRIAIDVVIIPDSSSADTDLVRACRTKIEAYLHPLTGGPKDQGWNFGEQPHPSDFYSLIESIRGLEYVRSLQLRTHEERDGTLSRGDFLICSGEHRVRLGL